MNPIETLWGLRKEHVAKHNVTNKIHDVQMLWNESRNVVSMDTIKNNFRHVISIENQFWQIDTSTAVKEGYEDSEEMTEISPLTDLMEDDLNIQP